MFRYKIKILNELKKAGYNTTRLKEEGLLSQSTIQDLRKGRMVGTLATLDKICCLLEMQPGDLIECHWPPKTTTVYEVATASAEFGWRQKTCIQTGCVFALDEYCPEILEKHEKVEDAIEALSKYQSSIRKLSGPTGAYYEVTEYAVQETLYDEDGDEVQTLNIWKFSELPELDF